MLAMTKTTFFGGFLALALSVSGLQFDLEAHPHGNERCLYQTFSKDITVSGRVRVAEGGTAGQRIDVVVIDEGSSDGSQVSKYWSKSDLTGEAVFKFTSTTWYKPVKFCVTNTLTSGGAPHPSTKKSIYMNLEVGSEIAALDHSATKEKLKPNEAELSRLESVLEEVIREMDYLAERERHMRDMNGVICQQYVMYPY
jgi:hypothetical protein